MKHHFLLALLISLFVPTVAVFALEGEEKADLERVEQHMQMQRMELELEHERAELEFENEMRNLELEAKRAQLQGELKSHHDDDDDDEEEGMCLIVLVIILIVHILSAIWVYQDIQKGSGVSWVWVVIALLAGLLGTLVYAVIRLVEAPQEE